MLNTNSNLAFTTEGWKNFIQTEEDLQVGQVVLITVTKIMRTNRLPIIVVIEIIMDLPALKE
jgi:hypothetical protein